MANIEEALEQLNEFDPVVLFTLNSQPYVEAAAALSEKYGASFDRLIVLYIAGALKPDDLAEYISNEFDFPQSRAEAVKADLDSLIFEPLARRLLFLNSDPEKIGITRQQEKDALRKAFAEGLLPELAEHFIIKDAFNRRVFDILEKDLNFKRELERLMYDNAEVLTQRQISVGGKEAPPTIGNWLKDFIDKKGTGDFTNVTLSDYMTNSINTRNLSAPERRRIFDVLNLYRNLKFFPDTVEGKPLEEWQILPFDSSEVREFTAKQAEKGREVEAQDDEALTIGQKLEQYDWNKIVGIERRALLEELGVNLKDFIKWLGEKK